MIELELITGKKAGNVVSVTRFPFFIGRRGTDLKLEAAGVWERHFSLARGNGGVCLLVPTAEAPISVSGQQVMNALALRNGDLIDFGAARLRFRVSPARQKGLIGRERTAWGLILGMLLVQLWFVLAWIP